MNECAAVLLFLVVTICLGFGIVAIKEWGKH
jgi:hypothetical protein